MHNKKTLEMKVNCRYCLDKGFIEIVRGQEDIIKKLHKPCEKCQHNSNYCKTHGWEEIVCDCREQQKLTQHL